MITNAYVDINEYCHLLTIETDDGYTYSTLIHKTGVKPPPIDSTSLEGRRLSWVLGRIVGRDVGDFPHA